MDISEVEQDVQIPVRVCEVLEEADFSDYVNVNSCAAVYGSVTDDGIIAKSSV